MAYNKNKEEFFRVKGCFCSFSCALAYCINNENDWEKSRNMLYRIYKKIGGKDKIIKSPPKTIMIQYGGNKTKREYRKMINKKYVEINMPPMLSVPPNYFISDDKGTYTLDRKRNPYINLNYFKNKK
jgi:hypothetical protein